MLVSRRENVGRELFTVDFDTGQRLILFAHEIETHERGAGRGLRRANVRSTLGAREASPR